MQINGKQLIVNGRVNLSLDKYEFMGFAQERHSFLSGVWSLVVAMTNSYSQHKRFNWDCPPSYDSIKKTILEGTELEALNCGEFVYDQYQQYVEKCRTFTYNTDKAKGKELGAFFKNQFCPGGEVELNTAQFLGFAEEAMTDFNEFKVSDLISAATKVRDMNIKNDYGINNPNTGIDVLKWRVSLKRMDHVWCVFTGATGITPATAELVEKMESDINVALRLSKPDTLDKTIKYWPKIDCANIDSDRVYSIEFKLWWD